MPCFTGFINFFIYHDLISLKSMREQLNNFRACLGGDSPQDDSTAARQNSLANETTKTQQVDSAAPQTSSEEQESSEDGEGTTAEDNV